MDEDLVAIKNKMIESKLVLMREKLNRGRGFTTFAGAFLIGVFGNLLAGVYERSFSSDEPYTDKYRTYVIVIGIILSLIAIAYAVISFNIQKDINKISNELSDDLDDVSRLIEEKEKKISEIGMRIDEKEKELNGV